MQRNGQKRDLKKIEGKNDGKKAFLNFFGRRFLTWTQAKKNEVLFYSPC
jgi:hypothetical protein